MTMDASRADKPCPDCGSDDAACTLDALGMNDQTPLNFTWVYRCSRCHWIAYGGDAMRANGVLTDLQTPKTWKQAARRQMLAKRLKNEVTP
jgi:hypothetical protein